MRPVSIIESPSNLGLIMPRPGHEPGVKKLPAFLKSLGFYNRIAAKKISPTSVPAYEGTVDKITGIRNRDEIIQYMLVQEEVLNEHLDTGFFPVVIGGDCSILIGNMFALKKRGRFGVFYLDGHTDYVLPAQSTTAGAAGMDLALIAGMGHDLLTDLHNRKPYVEENHIWCVGNREYDTAYLKPLLQSRIQYYDLIRLRKAGMKTCTEYFFRMIEDENLDGFWIHFDVDVLNNRIMPAVDSPAEDGLEYNELTGLLLPLLKHPKATGIQITILDPELDPEGMYTKPFVDELGAIINKATAA